MSPGTAREGQAKAWFRRVRSPALARVGSMPFRTALRTYRVLSITLRNFRDDGCFQLAAAIAFFTLLSFVPLVVLIVSGLTLVLRSQEDLIGLVFKQIDTYLPFIPDDMIDQVGDLVRHAGTLGGLAILFLFLTSLLVFDGIQNGLNRAFRTQKRRFFRSRILSAGMVFGTGLLLSFMVVVTAISAAAEGILARLGPLDAIAVIGWEFLVTYALPFVLMTFVFIAAIKGIPNTHVRSSAAVIGGLFGATLWEIAKHLFAWYIETVAQYNLIYGSLGTLVIGLIWVQYSASLLLLSAELAAVLNRDAAAGIAPR